jgi:hypothetical protein
MSSIIVSSYLSFIVVNNNSLHLALYVAEMEFCKECKTQGVTQDIDQWPDGIQVIKCFPCDCTWGLCISCSKGKQLGGGCQRRPLPDITSAKRHLQRHRKNNNKISCYSNNTPLAPDHKKVLELPDGQIAGPVNKYYAPCCNLLWSCSALLLVLDRQHRKPTDVPALVYTI